MENVKIESFNVIGIAIRTTNENGQGAKDIGALWQKFMSENILAQIPNKVDNTIYSFYLDYEGDYTQPYITLLACRVENLDIIPDGMIGKTIDGGSYMKQTVKGDLSKGLIINTWSAIWKMDLDRAYTADFEVFGEKAQDPLNVEMDFYIAVK